MPKAKKATAALGSPAPLPLGPVDPLVRERTRFSPDRTHRFTLFRGFVAQNSPIALVTSAHE